jgi:YQGE family putative transporter
MASALLMLFSGISNSTIKECVIRRISPIGRVRRVSVIGTNFLTGINFFVPSVLVMLTLGREGALGTVESITAFLSSIVLYFIGRKTSVKNSYAFYVFSLVMFVVFSLSLGVFYSKLFILLFLITNTIFGAIRWTSSYALTMEAMDEELKEDEQLEEYALVCDNELFFNIGRFFSVGVFSCLMIFTSVEIAIRVGVVIVGVLQLFSSLQFKKLHHVVLNTQG